MAAALALAAVGAVLTAAECAQLFRDYVLKAGVGFAIDANVSVNEIYIGDKFSEAQYFLVAEQGTGNVVIYPFQDETRAIYNSTSVFWSCNVVFNKKAQEISMGGMGFAHNTCRYNGARWLAERFMLS